MWSELEDLVYRADRADRVVRVRVILKRSIAEISVAVNDICFPQDFPRTSPGQKSITLYSGKFLGNIEQV